MLARDPTTSAPCGEFGEKKCRLSNANLMMAKTLNCKVPFFYARQELASLLLPDCSKDALVKALDLFQNSSDECKKATSCAKTKFIVDKPDTGYDGRGGAIFNIKYSDIEVRHEISSINYDMQSLIGEVEQ